MATRWRQSLAFFFCIGFLAGGLGACGNDASFKGNDGSGASLDGKGKGSPGGNDGDDSGNDDDGDQDDYTVEPYASLTWYWQCSSNPQKAPSEDGKRQKTVTGEGPHEFDPNKLDGTPIHFEGRLCKPDEIPRDIVFVIDTSGSMKVNDPQMAGSCGRLEAVREVIATVPKPAGGRFGVVAFDDQADVTSTAFFESEKELFADAAGGGSAASVLCEAEENLDPAGNTNYQAALTAAEELLAMGRDNAAKELYFVSDGRPNPGKDGIGDAQRLKNAGVKTSSGKRTPVSIATVMLGGQDTVLEQSIASRDEDGQPLHAYVDQTAELAKTLAQFADNEIVGGELKYRPKGAGAWTTLNLMDHLDGYEFSLPEFQITPKAADGGLEVLYEYRDSRGNRFQSQGELIWKAESGVKASDSDGA